MSEKELTLITLDDLAETRKHRADLSLQGPITEGSGPMLGTSGPQILP